jgi:flagellar FliL protein
LLLQAAGDLEMASKPKVAEASEAAEQENAGAEAAAPEKKKLPLKLIIMVAGGLVVLGGGGFGGYKMFFGQAKEAHAAAPPPKPAVFVDMPEILVNLSSAGSDRTQYLKVKMTLEVADQQMQAQLQPMMPRVTDTFQTYLRELRPSDLDGSAGLYRLKEELTRRVNALVSPHRVNAVLFKEIVVQ